MASVNGIHAGEPDLVEDPGHQLEGPLDMLDLSADQHITRPLGLQVARPVAT